MNNRSFYCMIFISIVTIFGLWFWAWYMGAEPGLIKKITNQPLADMFSSVNALFAGLALCGVILTVSLQIHELKETKSELAKTAEANRVSAEHAKESAVVSLFQTYCSEYFQYVKNSSMNVLIPAMASRNYFDFIISRFFVAEQKELSDDAWTRISLVTRYTDMDAFRLGEQNDRYKLDELINFFSILAHQNNATDVISRCDFSWAWWRPMFWMIAIAQQRRYLENKLVEKYATKPHFLDAVRKIDIAYGLKPVENSEDLVALIDNHPKLNGAYQLDPAHLNAQLWTIKKGYKV
jgi:hypothetical protein